MGKHRRFGMAIEDIKKELEERFAEPLEEFYKRRIKIHRRTSLQIGCGTTCYTRYNTRILSEKYQIHGFWQCASQWDLSYFGKL